MDTPIGREIVAEAVVAAAAAAATAMLKHRPSTAQLGADGAEMLRFGKLAVVRSSDAVEQALETLGDVVKEAVGFMKSRRARSVRRTGRPQVEEIQPKNQA
ncbi:MAG: hypothetical protein K0R27_2780 [Xanthobacteraceae bacterium]|jgi:hypothetical protein|nr:hypothetical protein [Xanthobacteraceae bacterium]